MDAIGRFFARYVPSANSYQRFDGIDSVASGTGRENPFNEAAPLAACRTGDLDGVKEEIGKDSSVTFKDYRSGKTGIMVSLLLIAAASGHLEVAELLINHGADVNRWAENGLTPLSYAAEKGHLGVVERLIEGGADVNLSTKTGSTPLSYAAKKGHLGVVELLIINHRADVNRQTEDGSTPLCLAAENGHLRVAKRLINHGADMNRPTEDGATPLYLAAETGHGDIVKLLFENGADPKKKWKTLSVGALVFIAKSPLTAARQSGHDEILNVIKKSTKERRVSSEHLIVGKHSSYGTF